jgi:hypothetical protein
LKHEPSIDALERVADPLADDTVAALMRHRPLNGEAMNLATRLMAGWTSNGVLSEWQPTGTDAEPHAIEALQRYLAEGAVLPEWADPVKVARAEQLFMDHGPLSCTLLFCTSLPECYVLPQLAEVLHIAGQLEAHTEHRIRQTAAMIFPVMMRGGLMSPEGAGVAQVLKVRLIHASIRHLILRGHPDSVQGTVAPANTATTPLDLPAALAAHGWEANGQGLPCNQVELAYTLLTFSYSFLQGMRRLGLPLSQADEEAYLHAWNVMGHLLGIQLNLMAHTMDEARDLFERIRHHALVLEHLPLPDPRPPLGQALMQTMAEAIQLPVIRHIPVAMTQWLIGPKTAKVIGVSQQVPWITRWLFLLGLCLARGIDTVGQWVSPKFSLSRLLTRIIGYHLLTRFLLNQTRPLRLPTHVINAMQNTVAQWSDDPHASPWLNRLEDRFTTAGPWHHAERTTAP